MSMDLQLCHVEQVPVKDGCVLMCSFLEDAVVVAVDVVNAPDADLMSFAFV